MLEMQLRLKSDLTLVPHDIWKKRYREVLCLSVEWIFEIYLLKLIDVTAILSQLFSPCEIQCPTHPLKIISLLQKCMKFHLPLSAGVLTSLISLAMGVLSCWHMKYISHMIILQSRDNYSHSLLREAFADQTDLMMKRIYCFSYLLIIRISWLGKQPRWSLHRGWIPPEFALLNHQVLLEDQSCHSISVF